MGTAVADGPDLHALADLQTPWCIRVVATLGIAALVEAGVDEIAALAAAAGSDPEALWCVLGHLVARGVFLEPEPGRFALNAPARQFLGPAGRFLTLEGIGGRMTGAWETLPAYVRTGRSAYTERFGRPFWDDLDADPELRAGFDALMGAAGHGTPNIDLGLRRGFEAVERVVDVGGGTGALLAEILRRHPRVQGTLVDLPAAVAVAAETFRAAGVADRVTLCAQSFFDPLPAGADLYLLWKVLNDWPDEATVAILRRCAEAAHPDGAVVINGGVDADDAPHRLGIDMVVAGGVTSSLERFGQLARSAGLEVVAAGRQPAGFIVECTRASSRA
jgi:hypothetical protein